MWRRTYLSAPFRLKGCAGTGHRRSRLLRSGSPGYAAREELVAPLRGRGSHLWAFSSGGGDVAAGRAVSQDGNQRVAPRSIRLRLTSEGGARGSFERFRSLPVQMWSASVLIRRPPDPVEAAVGGRDIGPLVFQAPLWSRRLRFTGTGYDQPGGCPMNSSDTQRTPKILYE